MKYLLSPRTVAVTGASNKPEKIGAIIVKNLKRYGRPIYPINPEAKEIQGIRAFAGINALPEKVDLAIIATGAGRALDAAYRCAGHGIKNLIVVNRGFGEAGPEGAELEARLKEIPAEFGTRILGPDTLGVFQPGENFDTIIRGGNERF